MSVQVGGNKTYIQLVPVRAGASAIAAGSPVILTINGTEDGLAVVLPSGSDATKAGVLAYGVAVGAIAANSLGSAQVYGFCRQAILMNRTRAATNATWQTTAALSVGQPLVIDTVNNCFNIAVAPTFYGTGANASSDTLGTPTGMWGYNAVVAQTAASSATQASSLGPVSTASTALIKVFLRMM